MTPTFGGLLQQGANILTADGAASATARYKLPAWLHDTLQINLDTARAHATAQAGAEGNRRTDSRQVQAAYEAGDDLIRKISRWLNSLDADDNIPAQRNFYGLGPDLPSTFRHEEIEKLLGTFVTAQSQSGLNPDAQMSAARLAKVSAVLAVIGDKSAGASIGARADISSDKRAAQDALEETIARVRYFLWCAMPQMFKDPLLHSYGFVPRQESATQRDTPPT